MIETIYLILIGLLFLFTAFVFYAVWDAVKHKERLVKDYDFAKEESEKEVDDEFLEYDEFENKLKEEGK
jgi:hypothetical protein